MSERADYDAKAVLPKSFQRRKQNFPLSQIPTFWERVGGGVATPMEALDRLRAGNARFMRHPESCVGELKRQRLETAEKHAPWAVIVGCSDSRVPPELVFGGQGLGDLFVVRTAGHVISHAATMGSIEYATAVLGAPLIVVLSHQKCGAVHAACQAILHHKSFPGAIQGLVNAIKPSVRAARKKSAHISSSNADVPACEGLAVEEHANRTAKSLKSGSKILAARVAKGQLAIVSALYHMHSGRVQWLQTV